MLRQIFVVVFLLLTTFTCARSEEFKLLFLGDQGHHVPARRFAQLAPVLAERGIELNYTEDVAKLNADTLKAYDGVVLYANIEKIEPQQADALLAFVEGGKGFVPLHCASFCFQNSPKMIALMGAQFQKHGGEIFSTKKAEVKHPILQNYQPFRSWDETYVHTKHNEKNRTVLEYRVAGMQAEGARREPWTWIRTQGKGRVFYTAWGHDHRTWSEPGFHELVERGIVWACGGDLSDIIARPKPSFQRAFPIPEMTKLPTDLKPFEYIDVGSEIPNYVPSTQWGKQEKPLTQMQKPIPAEESLKHIVVPKGFRVELFAAEPDFQGKPICMAWDERGRLWVAETVDYPNELQPPGKGRDRIRICEDTDGDYRADKFTVFAEELSIPTSIAFHNGGVIVQNGVETLYLKDTNGDDIADERSVLFSNWTLGDTHGGVSNFQYGLDNWIWAMQGYNNSAPRRGKGAAEPKGKAEPLPRFRMGFFRFRPDGSQLEFIRSTDNNTWGFGQSEEGLIFGSTANHNPSNFMPIANRYYERVGGWAPSLTLHSIADTHKFDPISDKVRQVDHHGGYTAAAGHALYTARQYPQEYWNRAAFVCGPTGKLVGTFVLSSKGAGFTSTSPFNLVASDDEWTAPIMAEVGPDGCVWVLDWYNFVVQHNPTPQGFKTGKGAAYESKLRDKKHGRVYRIVYVGDEDEPQITPAPNLAEATPEQLVAALSHPTMLVRKHAQRLLVERGIKGLARPLINKLANQEVDELGLNVGAIHALWTMHGLGLLDGSHEEANIEVFAALKHPSAAVRRNALAVLPPISESVDALLNANSLADADPQVQLAALLALADLPAANSGGAALVSATNEPGGLSDPWLRDATISAAANNSVSFLQSVSQLKDPSPAVVEITPIISEHFARGENASQAAGLIASLKNTNGKISEAVIAGFNNGWRTDTVVKLTPEIEQQLEELLEALPANSKGTLVRLATRWGSERFQAQTKIISKALLKSVGDSDQPDKERIESARQLIAFQPQDLGVAEDLLEEVTPQLSPALASGIIASLEGSQAEGLGDALVEAHSRTTPAAQSSITSLLLKRPDWTKSLLAAAEKRKISLDTLALDEKQMLTQHPNVSLRTAARKLFERGGSLPNPDRQKVLESLMKVTTQTGDAELGKAAFKKHCAKCHMHSGEGAKIGPDLTGMAVHPKKELLTHIIDPNRNVEGNFRTYKVVTDDGRLHTGMLASESQTAIELFDAEGKKHSILREEIEELVRSNLSLMPEGFEKDIKEPELVNLLEFLTKRGKFLPLDFSKAATIASDRSMFISQENDAERLIFPDWKPKVFQGVPFQLIDPKGGTVPNVILLHGPQGAISRNMPKSAELAVNGPAKAIHLLSGVSGWGHPFSTAKTQSMIVRIHYADKSTEDHELRNGEHFADYIRRVDVPGSKFAFALRGQQIRYLAITPKTSQTIERIEFVKGSDATAPVVMAATVEGLE